VTLDTTFLGLIALATTVMAAIQVGAIIFAAKAAREATQAARELRREIGPIIANAKKATDDAVQMTGLALAQVQRVDEFMTTTTARVEETMSTVQEAIQGSLQQGSAILAGLRAALAFFASRQERRRPRRDDDDEDEDDESLFIG